MTNNNSKCLCTALCRKVNDGRVCDFSYLESVFASDLSDYEKFIFCKHFSEPSFRHGWLLSFRRTIISDEEYHALETLAERKYIELRDEGNGFIAIGRPIWPELYHEELPEDG
ncbi:MAG: hypothetical protein FWH27_09775 [Planctomycetaceae bacterium]|nr:hypothetical protein [Planctomycetaceae bacterium]